MVGPDDDPDDIMEEAMQDMNSILSRVDKSGEGVCVQVRACSETWSGFERGIFPFLPLVLVTRQERRCDRGKLNFNLSMQQGL